MSLPEQARELAGKVKLATQASSFCVLIPEDKELIREAPDILRQLADENERLRRAGKIMADFIAYGDNPNDAIRTAYEYLDIAEAQREAQ